MEQSEFTPTFIRAVQALAAEREGPLQALDLGCGETARHARSLVKIGCHVIAIDEALDESYQLDPRIDGRRQTVSEWFEYAIREEMLDVTLLSLILHFLSPAMSRVLLPKYVVECTKPGGIVAIRAFYAQPEPAFDFELPSLHTLEDLGNWFPDDWQVLLKGNTPVTKPGQDGTERTWHTSRLIVRRPHA